MNPLRWRLLIITGLTLWALYNVFPSLVYFAAPKDVRNDVEALNARIPDWLPKKHVKLGLDLQGGVQLVLGVNTDDAIDTKLSRMGTATKRWSDEENHGVEKAYVVKGDQTLRVELGEGADVGAFREKFSEEFPGLEFKDLEGQSIDYAYNQDQIRRIKESAIKQAERVIRNRVDKWGVSEPVINRRVADNSILVQLPGFKNPGKAKELLGRTAQLTFQLVDEEFTAFENLEEKELPEAVRKTTSGGQTALVSEDRQALLETARPHVPADKRVYLQKESIAGGDKTRYTTMVVEATGEVTGQDVLDAFVTQDQQGLDRQPVVALRFTGPGGKRFGDVTGAHVGERLAIVLDDEVVSAPEIQSEIATGEARITLGSGQGYNEMYEEADELALILKSGALPATIEVLEERQVGASLGPELADQGIKGMAVGLTAVILFMLFYYRKPGGIAVLAILLNGIYLLALMAGFGFSLTLPGIAGFILTLGMAVDANVLINERIRQELSEGKNAKKAIENGFQKVFWTIVDANVTTLIAALVLLETNSSGPIRGFAITLMLGLLVSMFTSLYCSKSFFSLVLARSSSDRKIRSWLGGEAAANKRKFNIDFLRFGKRAATVGAVLAVAVLATGVVRGVNWGVDFAGGTEMMVGFDEDVQPSQIKDVAKSVGIGSLTLQALEGGQQEFLLRFGGGEEGGTEKEKKAASALPVQQFTDALKSQLSASGPTILQVNYVGPQIGNELRNQGIISVVYAIIGVLLYIGLRFDMRFGPGAVVKMIQDVFIMLGFYIFFWRSFDLTSVAAFLTVVGYSVNDTIVIYDRIREKLSAKGRKSLGEVINNALNETLSRTINTSVTTVLALGGILVFASGQIWNFAAAMAIGVIVATLSSTFIASSFVLWLENWRKQRAKTGGGTQREPVPARG